MAGDDVPAESPTSVGSSTITKLARTTESLGYRFWSAVSNRAIYTWYVLIFLAVVGVSIWLGTQAPDPEYVTIVVFYSVAVVAFYTVSFSLIRLMHWKFGRPPLSWIWRRDSLASVFLGWPHISAGLVIKVVAMVFEFAQYITFAWLPLAEAAGSDFDFYRSGITLFEWSLPFKVQLFPFDFVLVYWLFSSLGILIIGMLGTFMLVTRNLGLKFSLRNTAIEAFKTGVSLMYLPFFSLLLDGMACTERDGYWELDADPTIRCFTGVHRGMQAFSLLIGVMSHWVMTQLLMAQSGKTPEENEGLLLDLRERAIQGTIVMSTKSLILTLQIKFMLTAFNTFFTDNAPVALTAQSIFLAAMFYVQYYRTISSVAVFNRAQRLFLTIALFTNVFGAIASYQILPPILPPVLVLACLLLLLLGFVIDYRRWRAAQEQHLKDEGIESYEQEAEKAIDMDELRRDEVVAQAVGLLKRAAEGASSRFRGAVTRATSPPPTDQPAEMPDESRV